MSLKCARVSPLDLKSNIQVLQNARYFKTIFFLPPDGFTMARPLFQNDFFLPPDGFTMASNETRFVPNEVILDVVGDLQT
jgi:hypothetical protein